MCACGRDARGVARQPPAFDGDNGVICRQVNIVRIIAGADQSFAVVIVFHLLHPIITSVIHSLKMRRGKAYGVKK